MTIFFSFLTSAYKKHDDATDQRDANVDLMCDTKNVVGFDVVIVCTSNQSSEDYWQKRLEGSEGVIPKSSKVVAVHEDWEGGAGNGLGTLYAFHKAAKQYKGGDLLGEMRSGRISVGLYHTAGKGTRLAPLPGSECNNKPGVKLPGIVMVDGEKESITILESVIRQTGLYASVRKGRLSVFWGDQIFVPTKDISSSKPTHHADILAMLGSFPSAEEWKKRGLEKYGLILVNDKGNASQVEKVSHDTASELLKDMGKMVSAGTSLGSFSVSHEMLDELLTEFKSEIGAKKGKLDTDPHFWMPLTLPKDGYASLMERKGTKREDALKHWSRMQEFAKRFDSKKSVFPSSHLLGAVDVGNTPYWWDYGQLKYYIANNLKLTDTSSEESNAMRRFFHVSSKSCVSGDLKLSEGSVALSSSIRTGHAKGCVLVNCNIGHLEAENSVLVNVTAPIVKIKDQGVVYNVSETSKSLDFEDGDVVVDVCIPDESSKKGDLKFVRMFSHKDLCGGKQWKLKTKGNPFTFEEIYLRNQSSDISHAVKLVKLRRQNSNDAMEKSNFSK
jgi:hypothetical protein